MQGALTSARCCSTQVFANTEAGEGDAAPSAPFQPGKLQEWRSHAECRQVACVTLLEPAQRASATITCLQAMFVGCAAATLLRPGTKESASRGCEGGLTGRCGRSVEFLTRLLCVTHPHCVVVPVLRNALQTTAWLPYHSTYWIIPV